MRRTPLRRSTGLERSGTLARRTPLRRTALKRTRSLAATPAQRARVAGRACLACGRRPVDPAHLVPRSLGGCGAIECVVPLCRKCHRAYDTGALDLVALLEPSCRIEAAHAVLHLGVVGALRRLSGSRPDSAS